MGQDSSRGGNWAWMGLLLFVAASPIPDVGPTALLWAAPCLLLASLSITWGAESAQFFIAQGFALAILAWLQTLPEFAIEAVLAWHQQVPFLFANLTGALRILTGLGWPMIYFAAAYVHRKRSGKPMRQIVLDEEHSVNVIGLLTPLVYVTLILWKGTLQLYDAIVLISIYAAYLFILSKIPPQQEEGIDDLEKIPRAIVLSPRPRRILLIALCFIAGGVLIYFSAEPFLGSLMAVALRVGIPSFVFIQWVAPLVSEFPEMLSTFYWARTVTRAPMALMNMVSSNINQWTLLVAMLPIVYSISRGAASGFILDDRQKLEVAMTVGQALVGMLFLVNMRLAWWEAAFLFVLWAVQFVFSVIAPDEGTTGFGHTIHFSITVTYFVCAGWELLELLIGRRKPLAFIQFAEMWRTHVRAGG
jgi:cation:H+ antiporter